MDRPKVSPRMSNYAQRSTRVSAQEPSAVEVPERPVLAPGVELVGEMKETGFEDRQWLIQRDGRFIQLTELLYRIAEQADGTRTPGEIAEGATRSTEWLVNAENVRRLIETKLLPSGIVAPAAGATAHLRTVADRRSPSPLRVNGRMRILGPRAIDPIARVLQFLFAPLVLVPVLVAVGVAHSWLYFAHGLGAAVSQVLYAPGLGLAVLALLFLCGVFHELGHASALRYGGGRARGMGAGFYLVFPALYTDTTEVYRLGRWAKVRTDLGGFYFSLIFALGLMGLYLGTGWEFLLLAVFLISLDIVYQCLPFVRFDGYWALADLTGIPDFFSQMGAFLRSISPLKRLKGAKLPNLRPWVKAVFAGYVLVTVPVLSLLLFNLVANLPTIASIAWDSFLAKRAVAAHALGSGFFLQVALTTVEVFLLLLQVLAILYLLYGLSRGFVLKVVDWGNPTPLRRAIGVFAIVGVVALVAFLWTS